MLGNPKRRKSASALDCGGNRSATPLWVRRIWHAGGRRFHRQREEIQIALAAALCRRTPQVRRVVYPGDTSVIPLILSELFYRRQPRQRRKTIRCKILRSLCFLLFKIS